MEISFEYTKKRKDFSLPFQFNDTPTQLLHTIEPNKKEQSNWTQRFSTTVELDCIPEVAEMKVGTNPTETKSVGMLHIEGGWGKEINNPQDPVERKRGLDKLKGIAYPPAVERMIPVATRPIEQNNSVDMYENFFTSVDGDHSSEPPSCKTISVLRDPNEVKRSATNICWHPDGTAKMAVSYSVMQFQKMPANMPTHSYIWDVNSPNEPEYTLTPPSPACALAFNPRSPDWLVGGLYNGLIAFWDVRKNGAVETSPIEHSHHDPVYDVQWIQSRTNQEFCSVSTDGHIMWWDIRKLNAPLDSFACYLPDAQAAAASAGINDNDRRYGLCSLEYRTDAGATKFLVGTESGDILSLERKAKKDAGSQISVKQMFGGGESASHLGPVYSVKRNPANTKYFLSVGDWCTKIWFEDLKSPVMLGRYESSYLTSACWSPTRPGVYFTTKMDGTLDVWDLFYKQNEPVFPTKIGECGLTTINVHAKGKLAAVGAVDGTVSLLELSDSLVYAQNGEKATITSIFERESKREKHLDQMRTKRAAGRVGSMAMGGASASSPTSGMMSPTAAASAAAVPSTTSAAAKSFDFAEFDVKAIEAEFQQRLSVPPAGLGDQLKDASEEASAEAAEEQQ